MLQELSLENFILFEKTRFAFSGGLNAVSGETGAGKSLLAKALALLLGGRAGQDVVRAGCGEARIRGVFKLGRDVVSRLPARAGGGEAGEALVLERVVRRDGGGRISVNGAVVSAQAVRQSLAAVVDFSAQNEHVRLADPAYQREMLDSYGGLEKEAESFAAAFREAEALKRRLDARGEERDLVRLRLEKLRDNLDRFNGFAFDPGTDPVLEERIRAGASAAEIGQAAGRALDVLLSGEAPVADGLAAVKRDIGRFAGVSPAMESAAASVSAAIDEVGKAANLLQDALDGGESEPRELDRLIERSEALKALSRRLGCAIGEMAGYGGRVEAEIAELSSWDIDEDEVRTRLDAALPKLAGAGMALRERRRKAGAGLAAAVNRELAGLGMAQSSFALELEPLWQEGMPPESLLDASPSGLEDAVFVLAPNPGEAASPLAKTASGGEAARAVLALKAALSDVHRPPVLFLDEIDAGVGGRLGVELGRKLKDLAGERQVVVITHLPQIAAHAERHFRVAKKVEGGRTTAWAELLDGESRIGEVAQMIHGSAATDLTVAQAKDMLREAGAFPPPGK